MRSTPPRSMPGWLRRGADVATWIELGIAALATTVIFVLVLVQAAQRYLPIEGWAWTGELSKYCLVWLTFTAAGVLVTKDAHISLQLVDAIKRPVVTRFVRAFACLVVAVVGYGFAEEAWALVSSQGPLRSPAMQMPMSWLYVLPLLGLVSTTVRASVAAVVFAVRGVPAEERKVVVGE